MIWRGAVLRGVIRQLLKQMGTTFLLPKAQALNETLKFRTATMNYLYLFQPSHEQEAVSNEINL
jgi:hypothetical protein